MKDEYKDWCHEGSTPRIIINNQAELSIEQTLQVLQNIRDDIANGAELVLDDSEVTGCKHTHASWGMCSESPKHYPDKRMYTFPAEDPPYSALRWQPGFGCPMDRGRDSHSHWGCFYRCRLFRPEVARPTREEAIALYDSAITELHQI